MAVARQQFSVPAGFDDAPAVQHENAVGAFHRRQTVCDHQRGARAHEFLQCRLDVAFRFAVQSGGGFIEDQQRRILEQRAGDGDALPLAAR